MSDENQLVQLTTEFKKATDEVKKLGEDITGKMAHGEKITADLKEQADNALTLMNGFKARVDDLEQKLARRGEEREQQHKTFGEQFVESQNFKSLAESSSQRGRADMQFKATITLATTAVAAGAMAVLIKSSINSAAEIENFAKLAGSSTTEFQKFAAGASTVGVESDKLSDILKDVNDKVGDFIATGGGATSFDPRGCATACS